MLKLCYNLVLGRTLFHISIPGLQRTINVISLYHIECLVLNFVEHVDVGPGLTFESFCM